MKVAVCYAFGRAFFHFIFKGFGVGGGLGCLVESERRAVDAIGGGERPLGRITKSHSQ